MEKYNRQLPGLYSPIGEGMGKEKGEPSSGVKMGPEHPHLPPPPRPNPW